MRKQKKNQDPELGVQSITDAEDAHHVDVKARMKVYGIQMGIRMACFVAAYFTTGWVQVIAFLGAIFLPYTAVVLANVGDQAQHQPASYNRNKTPPLAPMLDHQKRLELEANKDVLASSFRTHANRRKNNDDVDDNEQQHD